MIYHPLNTVLNADVNGIFKIVIKQGLKKPFSQYVTEYFKSQKHWNKTLLYVLKPCTHMKSSYCDTDKALGASMFFNKLTQALLNKRGLLFITSDAYIRLFNKIKIFILEKNLSLDYLIVENENSYETSLINTNHLLIPSIEHWLVTNDKYTLFNSLFFHLNHDKSWNEIEKSSVVFLKQNNCEQINIIHVDLNSDSCSNNLILETKLPVFTPKEVPHLKLPNYLNYPLFVNIKGVCVSLRDIDYVKNLHLIPSTLNKEYHKKNLVVYDNFIVWNNNKANDTINSITKLTHKIIQKTDIDEVCFIQKCSEYKNGYTFILKKMYYDKNHLHNVVNNDVNNYSLYTTFIINENDYINNEDSVQNLIFNNTERYVKTPTLYVVK